MEIDGHICLELALWASRDIKRLTFCLTIPSLIHIVFCSLPFCFLKRIHSLQIAMETVTVKSRQSEQRQCIYSSYLDVEPDLRTVSKKREKVEVRCA